MDVIIGTAQIEDSKCQKLMGVNIDSKLTSEDHINRICKKASPNLNVPSRTSFYMDSLKRWLLVNPFLHLSLITVLLPGYFTVEN